MLPHDFQTELVQTAERGQVRASEGSVTHVEVFQMSGVGTFILGRPRPLPPHRHADPPQPRTTPSFAKSPITLNADGRELVRRVQDEEALLDAITEHAARH